MAQSVNPCDKINTFGDTRMGKEKAVDDCQGSVVPFPVNP